MAKIIPIPTDKNAKILWSDFVKKSLKAQETLYFEDGLEARTAWMNFLDAFITSERGKHDPL